MEVGVRIEAEHLRTGNAVHTGSSYLTFVALDEEGKSTIIQQSSVKAGMKRGDTQKESNEARAALSRWIG